VYAKLPDDPPRERTFKQIQINFERLPQCCKYLQDFLKIQMCYPHHTPFIRQGVLYIYNFSFIFVLVLQVTVIKNLAEEEKKDTKAFLKQQPFAKPGNICEKLQHIPTHN